MTRAIYPGSFDPVTLGHLDIIKRASKIVDELIVSVLRNNSKSPLFSVEKRVKMLEEVVKDIPNVKVMSFEGLLVDFAKSVDAQIIVRGLRAVTDFEYELQMSQTNMVLDHDIDTIFFTTSLEYAYLSSSTVKEAAYYGADISRFVPEPVIKQVYNKFNLKENRNENETSDNMLFIFEGEYQPSFSSSDSAIIVPSPALTSTSRVPPLGSEPLSS